MSSESLKSCQFGAGARKSRRDVPLNRKPSDSWLLSKDISSDSLNDGLSWGLGIQLVRIVFVVDVVADSDELPSVVAASQKDDSDAEDFGSWYPFEVWRVGFEDELVHAYRDGSHEERVKLLIMLGSAKTHLEESSPRQWHWSG